MAEFAALNADFIKKNLPAGIIGSQIIIYKTAASTNSIAAEYAKGGLKNNGLAVFAEHQTVGRGRRGNKWLAPEGKAVLCSVLYAAEDLCDNLVSLACAAAAAETLDKFAPPAMIKWPNDILCSGKKIAGILIETAKSDSKKFFVIGIGINCHQTAEDFPADLKQPATSIDIQSTKVCDRNKMAALLLCNLEKYLKAAAQNPQFISDQWKRRNILLGRLVTIEHNGKKFTGTCIGIEPAEGIVLQLERGGIRVFKPAHSTIVNF